MKQGKKIIEINKFLKYQPTQTTTHYMREIVDRYDERNVAA